MLSTRQKTVYKAFGMTIASDLPFPELPEVSGAYDAEPCDIAIVEADIAGKYDRLSGGVNRFIVNPDLVMFRIPDAGVFAVEHGATIQVQPDEGADGSEVRLLLLGTCMGAALLQRRRCPLHGSAVEIGGKAYAFIGDSGAGKSTLAAAFLNRGYRLVTDDVISVSLSLDGSPVVTPSYPQQKLWQASLDHFGQSEHRYRSIFGRHDKYLIPVASGYRDDPLPLAGVFELLPDGTNEPFARPLGKLERMHKLFTHTYRNFLVPGLGLTEWHFGVTSAVAGKTGMYRLHRPTAGFSAPDLVSLVLQTLSQEESS